jgi:hypothetical protein
MKKVKEMSIHAGKIGPRQRFRAARKIHKNIT